MTNVPVDSLWLDHIGLVVSDVAPVVKEMRAGGYLVSDPVALQGSDGPLGQHSAHCVFENFYLEISAPVPGSGNHLEPLLEIGPGPRILVLGSGNAAETRADYARRDIAFGPVNDASRSVSLASGDQTARFRWFPIENGPSGAITAVVEHQTPQVVFAEELYAHPNGARRIEAVTLGALAKSLFDFAEARPADAPIIEFDPAKESLAASITPNGGQIVALENCGFAIVPAVTAKDDVT